MGLRITQGTFEGAYGTFSEWRRAVAKAAGVKFKVKPGDWPVDPMLYGKWTSEPRDAIWYLIAHSDAEGFLSPVRCARLADRLELLLPVLSTEKRSYYAPSDQERAVQFIAGLRRAARKHKKIHFR